MCAGLSSYITEGTLMDLQAGDYSFLVLNGGNVYVIARDAVFFNYT